MTVLTKETDLLEFINQKKNIKLDITNKVLFGHYIKIINLALINTFTKIFNSYYTINCIDTVHLLFWFLINYSKNIKLSSFLCDRAILLYTEYIIMLSSPMKINSNKDDKIDLLEVKNFIYKKTIGPISVLSLKKNIVNFDFLNLCESVKSIYSNMLLFIINIYIDTNDTDYILDIFKKGVLNINKYLKICFFTKENSLSNKKVNLLYTFLELIVFKNLEYMEYVNSIVLFLSIKFIEKNMDKYDVNDLYDKISKYVDNKDYLVEIDIKNFNKNVL